MTLIEVRPHRWGWKVFESPGVEPLFSAKDHAIDYVRLIRRIDLAMSAACNGLL